MTETWRSGWGRRTSPALLRLDGRERAVLARDRDPRYQWPPYALFALGPTEVAEGSVTAAMPVTGWLLDSRGELGFPLLALVADTPTAVCVGTGLPAGSYPLTVSLRMEAFDRPSLDERELRCEADQETNDGHHALSSARLQGADGTLLAVAIARQVIRTVDVKALPELPSSSPERDETDLPFSRPPTGEPLPADTWTRRAPLSVLREQMAGTLPLPPLYHLTGMRPVHAAEGEVRLVLPAMHWLDTPVFGGALVLLASTAIELAGDSAMEIGARTKLLDLSCNYLRPGTQAGPDIEAHARTVHAGQQFRVVDCEVTQGRRVLMAARATLSTTDAG